MSPESLLQEARRRGLRITPREDNTLGVYPESKLTPDFEVILRQHKLELLAWLNAEHLAKQVLSTEFDGDGASVELSAELVSILNASKHPAARAALSRLFHAA
jgi:hypothetical protein